MMMGEKYKQVIAGPGHVVSRLAADMHAKCKHLHLRPHIRSALVKIPESAIALKPWYSAIILRSFDLMRCVPTRHGYII